MTNTLIRSVYLDGVHLAPGTELTAEQAERITNPKATEDLSVPGQDGRDTTAREAGAADSAAARKAAVAAKR